MSGFLSQQPLTPPASSIAASSTLHSPLPHPRAQPLKRGGTKESEFIHYVDATLLLVQRRWAKRAFTDELAGRVKGYHSFRSAARDLNDLVDVVWVSATPSFQIPYLLSIALLLTEFLPSFPAAPGSMFGLLEKLDQAFAALLVGRDPETGEVLPGIAARGVSTTEKIRMKSLVERTRVVVVEVMARRHGGGGEETDVDDGAMDVDVDTEEDGEGRWGEGEGDEEDEWEMAIGRVYEQTIGELGESVEGPPIGIITNGSSIGLLPLRVSTEPIEPTDAANSSDHQDRIRAPQ
ncbi:uncharacterized protein BDZ99DRAFT_517155 [Mytilinidion resinicola]|uniref:Meiotic recombination protein DMC1 n=1 Tax=Mytilinidion resinicola TaxID=574789 RepID=A0A6A6YY46_9PEZI|nr:uncharacterized protein BDZ99DRAFT_517155 [Mytilinidion resinicola]KAF2812845.1 hypothetical protein BDZ99DRAFT_517155 [Mytilinidion resinicola]